MWKCQREDGGVNLYRSNSKAVPELLTEPVENIAVGSNGGFTVTRNVVSELFLYLQRADFLNLGGNTD